MAHRTTIATILAGIVTLAATAVGVGTAHRAAAYNSIQSNPTIGCLAGLLELHGRPVTGSYKRRDGVLRIRDLSLHREPLAARRNHELEAAHRGPEAVGRQ